MRFRTDISVLKPTIRTLARWSQGSDYKHFGHAEMRAEDGLLKFTLTTPLGSTHLSVDAEVEIEGVVGVDIQVLAKVLAPIKGKDWEMRLSLDPCPKVEGRKLFVAHFREDGCKRTRLEWPYTGRQGEMFTSTDWVPAPTLPSGVIKEFRAPRPRLLELLQSGLAAHSTVEKNTAELHSAGLTVAADLASVYTFNFAWGVRAQLFADGDLGFDTGWEGEQQTIPLDAAALQRSALVIGAFGGFEDWIIQIPDQGPVRFCPESDPDGAWVTVPRVEDLTDLPSLLDEVRASKAGRDGVTKTSALVALRRERAGEPRALVSELESLAVYGAIDPDADCLTVSFEEDELVLEALSPAHIGAQVRIPWADGTMPATPVVRSLSCKRLLAAIKAITVSSEPDALVGVSFWANTDVERFYLSTHSDKGESADAVLCSMDRQGGPVRLAAYAGELAREEGASAK